MSKGIYIVVCVLIFVSTKAQVNLILNPSFEILDSCPNSIKQINYAKYWERMGTTLDIGCASSLMHTCCLNPTSCGINSYSSGGVTTYQFPRTGNGYCLSEIFPPPPKCRFNQLETI